MIPEFWSNYEKRRHLLNAIGSSGRHMESIRKRKKHDPVAEFSASNQAKAIADDRFCKEAADWARAAALAEREAIAAAIEAEYPTLGRAIAADIRSRPNPLSEAQQEAA